MSWKKQTERVETKRVIKARNIVSLDQIEEAVKLRVNENLSAPAIAKIIGVCNHTAYRILEHAPPWKPAPKLAFNGKAWTEEDRQTLKKLYPRAPWDAIMIAIPGRTQQAIQHEAHTLQIKRLPHTYRLVEPPLVHPFYLRLRKAREEKGLSRKQFKQLSGIAPGQILAWETGKTKPEFEYFMKWAAA